MKPLHGLCISQLLTEETNFNQSQNFYTGVQDRAHTRSDSWKAQGSKIKTETWQSNQLDI